MLKDSEIEFQKFKIALQNRQFELLEVVKTGGDAAGTVELDQSRVGRLSRMDALQNQAMSLESNRRRELELRNIASALRRIADDEYGICTECDQAIPIGRLQADPSVALCVQCASQREKL